MLESLTLVSFISGRITAGTSSTMLSGKQIYEQTLLGQRNFLRPPLTVIGRKICDELPEHVAGADGQTEIDEKIREVYEALYSSAGSGQEMDQIKARLAELIGASSLEEANKITGSVVQEAANLMEAGMSDVSGCFTALMPSSMLQT